MTRQSEGIDTARPVASPIVLVLISACHLGYAAIADLRGMRMFLPALAISLLFGGGYAIAAWYSRRERGYRAVVSLIVGEDLGILAAGLLLGYPWAEYLRPGTVAIIASQLTLAFAEIVRRQEAGRPIAPATRLAWFVVAYALAFAAYALLKPPGLWSADGTAG
jgi:hypothetical protein